MTQLMEVNVEDAFRTAMVAGYTFDEPCVVLGSPIQGDEVLPEVRVQVRCRASTATG